MTCSKPSDLKHFQSYLGLHAFCYLVSLLMTPESYSKFSILLSFYDRTDIWIWAMMVLAVYQMAIPWYTDNYIARFWGNFGNFITWGGVGYIYVRNQFLAPGTMTYVLMFFSTVYVMIHMRLVRDYICEPNSEEPVAG